METQNLTEILNEKMLVQPSPIMTNESVIRSVKRKVFLQLFRILNQRTGNPIRSIRLLGSFKKKYEAIFGELMLSKIAQVDNRYFYRLGSPGFPSLASKRMHQNEGLRF